MPPSRRSAASPGAWNPRGPEPPLPLLAGLRRRPAGVDRARWAAARSSTSASSEPRARPRGGRTAEGRRGVDAVLLVVDGQPGRRRVGQGDDRARSPSPAGEGGALPYEPPLRGLDRLDPRLIRTASRPASGVVAGTAPSLQVRSRAQGVIARWMHERSRPSCATPSGPADGDLPPGDGVESSLHLGIEQPGRTSRRRVPASRPAPRQRSWRSPPAS